MVCAVPGCAAICVHSKDQAFQMHDLWRIPGAEARMTNQLEDLTIVLLLIAAFLFGIYLAEVLT